MADEGTSRDGLLKEIEELRRREGLYRVLFDGSPELVYVHDLEGRFLDANGRALSVLGYTRGDIAALTFADLLPEEDVPRAIGSIRRIVEDVGADSVQQYRLRTKDGGHVWVETSGVRLVRDGVPYAILGFARDITERKQAEETRQESEALLKEAQKLASIGSWSWIVEADTVRWSEDLYEIAGLDPRLPPPTYEEHSSLYTKESWELLSAAVEMAAREGRPYDLELDMVRPDGQVRHTHTRGKAVADESGHVVRLHRIVQDITERKRTARALQSSLEIQRLENDISASLMDARGVDIDDAVNSALEKIARFTGASRSSVFVFSDDLERITNTHEWCEQPSDSQIAMLQDLPFATFGWHRDELLRHNTVAIRGPEDYPAAAKGEREWVEEHGFRSLLFVPLLKEGRLHGTVGVYGKIGERVSWPLGFADMLGTTGSIILNALERKRAEESLRKSEEWYRALIQSSSVAYDVVDVEGNVLYASPSVERMFGWTPEEIKAQSIFALVHPDNVEEVVAAFGELVANPGRVRTVDMRYKHKDGSWRDIQVSGVNMAENPIVGGIVLTSHDITERARAEEEIKHLARFPSENPSPVLRVKPDGAIVHANPASRPLLEEWKAGVGDRLPEDIAAKVAESRVAGVNLGMDVAIPGRIYSFVLAPVPDADYVNMYGRDVTEHRKLEEHLRHTQKMEAIGTLAGGIAHDFNNLLQGILGYADLLKLRSKEGGRTHEAADVIGRAGARAAELTQQLLGFARKGKLRDTPVDMHRTIGNTVAILARTIDKRITMTQHLNAKSPVVKGDPGQLEQVILNLAVNARDAMPEGGELTFETRLVDHAEGCRTLTPDASRAWCLLVRVSDTGVGMTPEVRERIFEPFYTTKSPGEGTGMGLAMVYGIVKNHGGTVIVRSEPGNGASFDIYLPLAGKGARITDTQKLKAVPRGSGRVLVVDDEEIIREILTDMLTSLDYDVHCARDGREAVDHFREHADEIDLVLLDMTMPVMNGPECFMELRKIDPGVKVVVTTGHALDGAAQETIAAGALRFLHKPFMMAELAEAVAKALAR